MQELPFKVCRTLDVVPDIKNLKEANIIICIQASQVDDQEYVKLDGSFKGRQELKKRLCLVFSVSLTLWRLASNIISTLVSCIQKSL